MLPIWVNKIQKLTNWKSIPEKFVAFHSDWEKLKCGCHPACFIKLATYQFKESKNSRHTLDVDKKFWIRNLNKTYLQKEGTTVFENSKKCFQKFKMNKKNIIRHVPDPDCNFVFINRKISIRMFCKPNDFISFEVFLFHIETAVWNKKRSSKIMHKYTYVQISKAFIINQISHARLG